MITYKFVLVHDRYDSSRSTRIRCEFIGGEYYCSERQKVDAIRRASVMPGSTLRADIHSPVYVVDDDGRIIDFIEGA